MISCLIKFLCRSGALQREATKARNTKMSKEHLVKYLLKEQPHIKSGISVSEKTVYEPSPLHWHNYIEIELITDGEGEQLFNGKRYLLKRGYFSLIRLTDYHQVFPNGGLSLINLSFEENLLGDDILSAFSSPLNEFHAALPKSDFDALERLSLLCLAETEREAPNRQYVKTLLRAFFIKLFESAGINREHQTSENVSLTPFRRSLEYLHSHFREAPPLSEVAKIAHYNPSHFSVVFRREMGENYSKYLNGLRLNYAKELLSYSDLKLEDVCFECGFTSYANFLKIFKERTGVSPSEYRESVYGKNTPAGG